MSFNCIEDFFCITFYLCLKFMLDLRTYQTNTIDLYLFNVPVLLSSLFVRRRSRMKCFLSKKCDTDTICAQRMERKNKWRCTSKSSRISCVVYLCYFFNKFICIFPNTKGCTYRVRVKWIKEIKNVLLANRHLFWCQRYDDGEDAQARSSRVSQKFITFPIF